MDDISTREAIVDVLMINSVKRILKRRGLDSSFLYLLNI